MLVYMPISTVAWGSLRERTQSRKLLTWAPLERSKLPGACFRRDGRHSGSRYSRWPLVEPFLFVSKSSLRGNSRDHSAGRPSRRAALSW